MVHQVLSAQTWSRKEKKRIPIIKRFMWGIQCGLKSWTRAMINDALRNNAYFDALETAYSVSIVVVVYILNYRIKSDFALPCNLLIPAWLS